MKATIPGHLDIMGELYSEFLKYALGDGKELGIVLTPPYVTKMMSELLGVNAKSFVMDLATGRRGIFNFFYGANDWRHWKNLW